MNKEKIDLSFFLEPPELTAKAELEITALAPLSMVSSQPGSYFRSELAPTDYMLFGMLENALGWHFSYHPKDKVRQNIIKGLAKQAKKVNKKNVAYKDHPWLSGKAMESRCGFHSLLQYHLSMELKQMPQPEEIMTYDDLWSMGLRDDGINFRGGSRHYDARLEDLINLSKTEDPSKPINKKTKKHAPYISFGDRAEYKTFSLQELLALKDGKIKTTSLKPYFPMYYSSPRKRGYVVPKQAYTYEVRCTTTIANLLATAINEPAAPLYLGSNDGWVDAKWNAYDRN